MPSVMREISLSEVLEKPFKGHNLLIMRLERVL
jgi:hypothetical protein